MRARSDLTRGCSARHALGTAPLGRDHEQRPLIAASEHAREAASVEGDRVHDLATFAAVRCTR